MHSYIIPLAEELSNLAEPARAVSVKAYMKNQFEFFGMPMAERRAVCKEYMKRHSIQNQQDLEVIVEELWMLPEREFQYFGIELMAFYKKLWQVSIINLLEYCIVNKSWWDTVDFLASECTGKYFLLFSGQITPITGKWNVSDNIWLQRSSLLFQKSYKKATDTQLLSKYILHLSGSKEFFVQKAIGWMLREYAKTNPAWVVDFVNTHTLPALSKREAMKHL
jgi:3-methyladenine DNA glycosylase AlkD